MDEIEIINGDLLLLNLKDNEYICQQCNCKTIRGKGLSQAIFDKYPNANIYNDNTIRKLGNIIIRGNIINIIGQVYPGRARYTGDAILDREKAFVNCLMHIENNIPGGSTLFFPARIGCGLAGGDWKRYYKFLTDFSVVSKNKIIIIDNT